MNGMQIWEVNGIDDLEGTCFAHSPGMKTEVK